MHPARTSATMPPSARLKVPLRPGVSFPDWSVVDSRTVCEALDAIIAALGAEKRWSNLEDAEDRVRRSILDYYAEAGHSPSPSQLVEITGFGPDELGGVLENIAPPTTRIVTSRRQRVFLVPDDERTVVQFSKEKIAGQGLSFNDGLTVQMRRVQSSLCSLLLSTVSSGQSPHAIAPWVVRRV